jgi:YtkA-like
MNQNPLKTVPRVVKFVPVILVALLACALNACKPPDPNAMQVKLETIIPPSGIGKTSLVFKLEKDENPITDAIVSVENTMTHAGMIPVTRPAQEIGNGKYQVQQLEFQMAGDYVLTMTAKKEGRILTGEARFGVQP